MLQGTFKTAAVLGQAYLKGDITQAYSNKVREVKQSFVFLKLGRVETPAALIVFDRVVAASPTFQKYWLLQSVTKPELNGSTAAVSLSRNGWTGKLVNTTLLPEPDNTRLVTVGGAGKEFWVFGKNYRNATVPPDPEVGGWRVELSPKQPGGHRPVLECDASDGWSCGQSAGGGEDRGPRRGGSALVGSSGVVQPSRGSLRRSNFVRS
jgi:hypothetical protein